MVFYVEFDENKHEVITTEPDS